MAHGCYWSMERIVVDAPVGENGDWLWLERGSG
jgi:hypothetical protein